MQVMLDPGHGGRDPGAIGPSGLQEKVVNLAVAKKVALILRSFGVSVKMTRDSDKELGSNLRADLSARAAAANGANADIFVSIHCNSVADRTAHGGEVFTSRGDTKADQLATVIIKSMESALPELLFRKDYSDGDPDKEAGFSVLVNTLMPAVLIELAFISNPKEEALLKSVAFQDKTARAIADGIANFLGVTSPAPTPAPEQDLNTVKIKVGNMVLEGILINDRSYAPVRTLAEALGKKVTWDEKNRTVIIE